MIKFTPDQWQKILGVEVLDPDGWDRSGNFQADWAKPLTLNEFLEKTDNSTTSKPLWREMCRDVAEEYVTKNISRLI